MRNKSSRTSDKSRFIITAGAFVSMGFLGMSRTYLGTALPAIRSSLNLTLVEAGTLTALLQLGFTTAVFVGGPLADVFRKSTMLMLGCFIMGLNLVLFGVSHWLWASLLGMSLIGIGGGFIETSSDSLLLQLYPGRESAVMNLHHFFFAIGSLAGPLIVGAALVRLISWQWTYIGFGLFVLLIFVLFTSQRISTPKGGARFDLGGIRELLISRPFLVLFLVVFSAAGLQNGIAYWGVTFLTETKDFPITLAGASLSLFFASVAVGRLFSSYFIMKFQDVVYLSGLFLLLFVFLLLSVVVPGKWAILFFGICGLAQSGIFPCLMAMAGKLYLEKPGTAMGTMATGAGLGAILIPWLMSFVSQVTNLTLGFLFLEFFVIFCLGVMGIELHHLRRLASSMAPPIRKEAP
jgi:FHS family glucose/mannose:H+ symporter-like MFS transporter